MNLPNHSSSKTNAPREVHPDRGSPSRSITEVRRASLQTGSVDVTAPTTARRAAVRSWRRTVARVLLLSLCLLSAKLPEAAAQCTGEAVWETASTNHLRCGTSGYVTNLTYYSFESHEEWVIKVVTEGTATNYYLKTWTYNGGSVNPDCDYDHWCSTIVSDYGYTSIPFTVRAIYPDCAVPDITNGCFCDNNSSGWPCTTNCGRPCDLAFAELLQGIEGVPSITDTTNDTTYTSEWVWTSGAQSKTERTLDQLSGPYTIQQFANDTMQAATNSWHSTDGGGGSLTSLPYRQCMNASISRYKIKFKSDPGPEYTVKWDVIIHQTQPTDIYYPTNSGSWTGIGNGMDMFTDTYDLPLPAIDQAYTAQIVNICITSDGKCNSCVAGGDGGDGGSPGDGGDQLGSASFWIGLGAGTVDQSAGILRLKEDLPSTNLTALNALKFYINTNVVTVATNGDGTIDLAAPTVLAKIAVSNSYAYWVNCSAKSGGIYLTNAPFISHLLINPNGSTNADTLQHIRIRSGVAVTNVFVCETNNATNITWSLVSGNNLKGERLAKLYNTNTQTRLECSSIFIPTNSQQLYRRDRLYWTFLGSDYLLSEIIDPGGLNLMTTNTVDSAGRILISLLPDGGWFRNEYDANGWLLRTVRPFTNQPPTASTNDCRVTEYTYSSVSGSPDSASYQIGKPRTVTEFIQGQPVSRTMNAYQDEHTTFSQTSYKTDAAWDDASNEKSDSFTDSQYRLVTAHNADGTATYIEYTDTTSPTGRLTKTWTGAYSGTIGSGAFFAGTRTEQFVDAQGRMVGRTNYDLGSNPNILIRKEIYSVPDDFGRPTTITYLDGSSSVNVKQDCCHAAYTIDRDGSRTDFAYDLLNRIVATTKLGITVSNMLDTADNLLVEKRRGTDGSIITLRGMAYDAAKRVIRQTNALGGVTWFSDTLDGSSQRILATTNADGGIRIETYFRDGQPASVTGSAALPVRYEYGQELDGAYRRAYRKEIKLDFSFNDTPEWTKTYTDGAGHAYKNTFAGGSWYRQSFFNSSGQLWKDRDPDGVATLFRYNTLGERCYTVIDSNRNDVIDFSGVDRITQTTNYFVAAHGTNVLRRETWIWADNGSSTRTLLSSIETSVEGLKTWQTNAGVLSSSIKSLPTSGTYSLTQTAADGTYATSIYTTGRLVSVTRYASNDAQIGKTTYGYDTQGRQNTVTDARNGTTTFASTSSDQVSSVTTPQPGNGQGAQVTTTYYDKMLRATNIVQPDGGSVTNQFSLRGELVLTKGARTYPTGYAFDPQGRMKRMTNWSNFGSLSNPRVTTWNYHPERGWLTNKSYADGLGPKYAYTAAGRLSTRMWARGITTTYSYNNLGDLAGVSYDDGITANLAYSFTRSGQQQAVTQGTNSWRLFYTLDGQLLSEAWMGGMLTGVSVTNAFDSLLRRTNVSTMNGSTQLTSHGYSFNVAGRLDSARDGNYSATYSYLTNSPFVSQILFKDGSTVRMTTTKQYDFLNRLSTIANQPSGDSLVSFSYLYNTANQRARMGLADGSYWVYQYDSLGQVISGKKYWQDGTPVAGQQYEYAFDDIGNRTSTKAGGDQSGANLRSANYTNNTLNQITSRDIPGAVDLIGAATATATNVNVNGQLAYRRGEYYQVALQVSNTTAAVWQSVTNQAIKSGTTSNAIGNVFLPKTAEVCAYDADGNLTNDGRWMLVWDAENRLIQTESQTNAPTASKKKVAYAYDWRGRLIWRSEYDGSSGTYVATNSLNFLSDGWRCVAELNPTSSVFVRGYLWGLNMMTIASDGAGGLGGLLALNIAGSGFQFLSHDGTGDVIGLVNSTGSYSATYEFDPFGNLIRSTGNLAADAPYGFETKRLDKVTGFIAFQNRILNPSTGTWIGRSPVDESGSHASLIGNFYASECFRSYSLSGYDSSFAAGAEGVANAPNAPVPMFATRSLVSSKVSSPFCLKQVLLTFNIIISDASDSPISGLQISESVVVVASKCLSGGKPITGKPVTTDNKGVLGDVQYAAFVSCGCSGGFVTVKQTLASGRVSAVLYTTIQDTGAWNGNLRSVFH